MRNGVRKKLRDVECALKIMEMVKQVRGWVTNVTDIEREEKTECEVELRIVVTSAVSMVINVVSMVINVMLIVIEEMLIVIDGVLMVRLW